MTIPDDNLPDHVRRNREAWDAWAVDYVDNGERSWRLAPGPEKWGNWSIPEADIDLLPADLAGQDANELGCGAGCVPEGLARRRAPPGGIANPEKPPAAAPR